MRKMKDKRINVRVAEHEKKALADISEKLDITEADIVRDAVKEKIVILSKRLENKESIALPA